MSAQTQNTRKLALKLLVVAIGMFGFGFAMVPIYYVICDITGLGGRGVKVVRRQIDGSLCAPRVRAGMSRCNAWIAGPR